MENLITLISFSNSTDFELVKSYLESEGIECFGKDEITNRTYFSNVNGGAKLQVKEEQLDKAIQILTEKGYIKPEDFELSPEMKWAENVIVKIKKILEK